MKSVMLVLREQVKHFYLIRRLSLYELKSNNNSNYLGMAWEIINPIIQIMIYWFVFGYGIRSRSDVDLASGEAVPYILWMVTGFILWTFFYQSTIQGSKSIYTRLRMLSKMNFPMSVIPTYVIFSQFYIHMIMVVITTLILLFNGYVVGLYTIQIIYFLFATIAFSYALGLITSTLSTIIRDVHMLLNASLRMLLYLSPVLWSSDGSNLSRTIKLIMRYNPLYYLIEGYRASFFNQGWYFIDNVKGTISFWLITIVLLFIGANIHVKFRKHFIDFL